VIASSRAISATVDHARRLRAAGGAGLGYGSGMRYGATGGVGWLLAVAACGGAAATDEGGESFGGGTQVETSSAEQTTTGIPTTSGSTGEPATGSTGTTGGTSSGEDPSTSSGEDPSTSSGEDPSTSSGEDSSGGTTGEEVCEAPGLLLVCDDADDDPFHALGLGCEGAPENTIPITNAVFKSQKVAYRVARGFGTAVDPNDPDKLLFRPREGERFLVLSTGQVAALDPDGFLVEQNPQYDNGNNFNPDDPNELPAPMSPDVGSNGGKGGTPSEGCDGVNDCSDSIGPNWTLGNGDPNDVLWASFKVVVPGGTHGFGFDVAYFSSEYPEFVGKQFNDMFIGWSTSEAYTGNVTFFNNQPFTVTALGPEMKAAGFVDDDAELAGTGFEGHGSTGWVTINAPAVPGETLTFALAIMDMGDSNKATVAVVDNWRWSCAGCVSEEVDPACGQEGHPDCCGVCVAPSDDPKCNTPGHPMCCVPK